MLLAGVAYVLDATQVVTEREEEQPVGRIASDGSVHADTKANARLFVKVDGGAPAIANSDHLHFFCLGAERVRVWEIKREQDIKYVALTLRR
jgi:hypothetical protein